MNEEERETKQREAGNRETARLWRAWRTIHELVQDRGYILSEAEVKISLEDFERQYQGPDGHIEYAFPLPAGCEIDSQPQTPTNTHLPGNPE